jgi:DNA-binding transcriptional ArsR family regulator
MDALNTNASLAGIAAAIGEPARALMLSCLTDGHARTSTELAMVAGVSPSTASEHLSRLKASHLVEVHKQGKHRYYSLAGPAVAGAIQSLSALAGGPRDRFVPHAPSRLRAARTCYDHIAGALGVSLHDRFTALKWLSVKTAEPGPAYDLTRQGAQALEALGIDIQATRRLRRRFAGPCLDWSERRPHLGGALAAALLEFARKKKWVIPSAGSRALRITPAGRRELHARFGVRL